MMGLWYYSKSYHLGSSTNRGVILYEWHGIHGVIGIPPLDIACLSFMIYLDTEMYHSYYRSCVSVKFFERSVTHDLWLLDEEKNANGK